jgi:hypothetical protein
VCEVEVVHRGQRGSVLGAAGCVHAAGVAEVGAAPRLVQRDEQRHPVAQRRSDDLGVLTEPLRGAPLRPAAGILERLREVPVVQRDRRGDPVREQLVDQVGVEAEAFLVHRAELVGGHLRGDP